MKLADIKKNIKIPIDKNKKDDFQRGYFWDNPYSEKKISDDSANSTHVRSKKELDRQELGVSSELDKPLEDKLDRQELGVSSELGDKPPKKTTVSSELDKPLEDKLDRQELGVSSELDVDFLVGKEKQLVFYIANECRKNGSLETEVINSEDLKRVLSIDSLGLRNLIHRVKLKHFFTVSGKNFGRVGLRKFKITKDIYHQCLGKELDRQELGVSSELDKPLDKPLEMNPIVSSNFNINTNTIKIPENLSRIISQKDVSDIILKKILTEDDLTESLENFSYDYANGYVKAKTNPISLIHALLKSGRKYNSVKLIELQNEELKSYEESLKKAEKENLRLKEDQLKHKFSEFLKSNETFLKEIEKESLIKTPEIIYQVGFEKYKSEMDFNK